MNKNIKMTKKEINATLTIMDYMEGCMVRTLGLLTAGILCAAIGTPTVARVGLFVMCVAAVGVVVEVLAYHAAKDRLGAVGLSEVEAERLLV